MRTVPDDERAVGEREFVASLGAVPAHDLEDLKPVAPALLGQQTKKQPPNILLITADDMNWDCPAIFGDRLAKVVRWKSRGGDVRSLAGQPIRLRFVLKDADLYAFQFVPYAPDPESTGE